MGTKNYKVYIPPAILAVFFCNAIISTVNQISLSCLSGSLVCTTLHLLAMSPFLFPIAFAFVVTAIAFVAQKVLVQVTREGKRSVDTALVSLALFLGAVLAAFTVASQISSLAAGVGLSAKWWLLVVIPISTSFVAAIGLWKNERWAWSLTLIYLIYLIVTMFGALSHRNFLYFFNIVTLICSLYLVYCLWKSELRKNPLSRRG
jgi:hypothetical protein